MPFSLSLFNIYLFIYFTSFLASLLFDKTVDDDDVSCADELHALESISILVLLILVVILLLALSS